MLSPLDFFKLGFKRALEQSKGEALPIEIKVEGGHDYTTEIIEFMKPYKEMGSIEDVEISMERHLHVDEDVLIVKFMTTQAVKWVPPKD